MRHIVPAVAAAAALTVGAANVSAAEHNHKHGPKHHERVVSHLALHLSSHDVLAGNGIAVEGKVRPGGRHRVRVVFDGPEGGHVGARTKADGSFAVRFKPDRTGTYSVRAYGLHDRRVRGSVSSGRKVTSYRLAGASWYGPGLWGNGVACGGTLMPGTLGVANKTLPCGTKVTLRYHGREITVPVIDRGPYVAGREFDLTYATKQRLGFPGVGTVMASR